MFVLTEYFKVISMISELTAHYFSTQIKHRYFGKAVKEISSLILNSIKLNQFKTWFKQINRLSLVSMNPGYLYRASFLKK